MVKKSTPKTNKTVSTKSTKTQAKKIPGKSTVTTGNCPTYKPSIYLDNGQIPKNMISKVGSKVNLVVTGKIVSTSERADKQGKTKSISIEIDKIK